MGPLPLALTDTLVDSLAKDLSSFFPLAARQLRRAFKRSLVVKWFSTCNNTHEENACRSGVACMDV